MSTNLVNPTKLALRLASVFVTSAVPNIAIGAALDVSVWKSALMAGGVAVLSVLYAVASAYKKDGDLTEAELQEILDILEASTPAPTKKAPAKKKAPEKKTPAKKTTSRKVTK